MAVVAHQARGFTGIVKVPTALEKPLREGGSAVWR
jgi:hypothetical protein